MDTNSAQSRYLLRQAIVDELRILEESTWALRSRCNELVPISCLPPEILAATFSFLAPSASNSEVDNLTWIWVTHVCRRWREIALNYPCLWTHIDFTKLTPTVIDEMLARAKMAPLHLEADFAQLNKLRAFERQLQAHISHTRHLGIRGRLASPLYQLVSSTRTLDYTSTILTSLELERCDITCWRSPLLKGLQILKILQPPIDAIPDLEDWLDALNEMPQLETLILQSATPLAPYAASHISEPSRAVTLPSLTRFHLTAPAKDCVLAFAHLVLPALTWLHVDAESLGLEGEDVRLVIPYVSQNVDRIWGTETLRSILIDGGGSRAKVVAWTMPDADAEVGELDILSGAPFSARLMFTASDYTRDNRVGTAILDSLLALLPMDSVSTLTVMNSEWLSKEFWLSHASRLSLLERARLGPIAFERFRDMLAEDAASDGPRLPSLTRLTLDYVRLAAPMADYLGDMLIERVEKGVPLEVLDLRKCVAADREIQLLEEIVVDVLLRTDRASAFQLARRTWP